MHEPLDTEIVFVDLQHSYEALVRERRSPVKFRRAFESYLMHSQQLTEVMRKEYPRYTASNWDASSFTGWDNSTRALKTLRNLTIHGTPLVLHQVTLGVYPAIAFSIDKRTIGPRQTRAGIRFMRGVSFVDQPFCDQSITPRAGIPPKHGSGWIFPLKEFVSYEIQWHRMDHAASRALNAFGSRDAVRLALVSFPVLRTYVAHFKEALTIERKI